MKMRLREPAISEPKHDWESCIHYQQRVGFTIGIKSGDAHIADVRVCIWDFKHIALVKQVDISNASADAIADALAGFDESQTRYILSLIHI